jgi:hypothetical protein
MRYNIIVWDLTKPKRPELLADTWANKEVTEAIDVLKSYIKSDPMSRGIVIDWANKKVVAELQYKQIKEYK